MIHNLEFFRTVLLGYAARVWRAVKSGECPCGFCEDHRAFIAECDAYLASVHVDTDGDVYRLPADPGRPHLPTLAEVRRRRGL